MTSLSVNVNKVATLRNTRALGIPDPAHFAEVALRAGSRGVTVHPRPDRRHVRPGDVEAIARLMKRFPHAEYNIEGNPFQGDYFELVRSARPHQCTLVPDDPGAFTSDHGWDVAREEARLRPAIAELKALGCRVSLFVDADPAQAAAAAGVGADRVELYTEPYAAAFARGDRDAAAPYAEAARAAIAAGLGVNAGHDLNLDNLGPFLAAVPGVLEVSIGHALLADALEFGLAPTVARYLDAIASASSPP